MPSFEPGVWVGLQHDAVLDISYAGVMNCFEEGNRLLGHYKADIVSIHDPDEYLLAATNDVDYTSRLMDILDGYRALLELKKNRTVKSIGVGAKDAKVIELIVNRLPFQLDWVMIAVSLTVHDHSAYVQSLVKNFAKKGIQVLNSGVFNSGFLVGGMYYNYKKVSRQKDVELFRWRDRFRNCISEFNSSKGSEMTDLDIDVICIGFSFLFAPDIRTIVLNANCGAMVERNITSVYDSSIPFELWRCLVGNKIISSELLSGSASQG